MKRRSLPIRRTPVKRFSEARRARSGVPGKLGIVRLYGADLEVLRVECFMRDKGVCQRCGKGTVFGRDQECDDAFHMAHRGNKRMYGDVIGNVQTECGECHRKYHRNGPSMEKPCPPKTGLK